LLFIKQFIYDLSDNNFLIQLFLIVIVIFGIGWWLYWTGKEKDVKKDGKSQLYNYWPFSTNTKG